MLQPLGYSNQAISLWLCRFSFVVLTASAASPTVASEPLHLRIDRLVQDEYRRLHVQPASVSSDAEFMRRVYLDLVGTIPTSAEAHSFFTSKSPDKRQQLVDRLLASPAHARRLRDVFDVLLMDRRREKHVPQAQWQEYLRTSLAANKPWDQLVREILSADGTDPKMRAAAKFYLEREAEPTLITRDISRLFLGMNLQCAQCHDHPVVSAYHQQHFQGLYAFLNRSYLFTDKNKQAVLAEKAEGEVSYQSVFDPAKVTKMTGPRLLEAKAIEEPKLVKGQEYIVPPAKEVRPVPKFSRRAQLAGQIASPDNVHFKRNAANRLWDLMMGRGLVYPLDMDHEGNPPSHPELLTLLAEGLAAHKFDMRFLIRELALSQTYQRSSELPAYTAEAPPQSFAVAQLKPLTPEQLAWTTMQATGLADAERLALGKKADDEALYNRLKGNVAPFIATFGGKPGQPEGSFQATLDQALFLRNGAQVRGWLAPRAGNLVDRLQKLQDAKAVADELYVSVLTRLPENQEYTEVAEYLRMHAKDRLSALQELVWALLTSAEFRFNH